MPTQLPIEIPDEKIAEFCQRNQISKLSPSVQDKSWKSEQEKGFMELLATNETLWMRLL